MKKLVPAPVLLLLLFLSACSNAGGTSSSEQTYTGILEENKVFMITVGPTDKNVNGESYVFATEGIDVDAAVGDKVIVTYTGDIDEVGSLLDATKVEKTE